MKFLLARKIGMTSIFDANGAAVPVTLLQAGPCVVTQVKTNQQDGYSAVQLGFGELKKPGKSRSGHLKSAKAKSQYIREYRIEDEADVAVGDVLTAKIFSEGDQIVVRGTSKGKGFAGTIKRHNFHRGPKTHGSNNYRAPGSIGAGYPEHVMKGMKMAGHMGHVKTTVKNLPIIKIDETNNLIAVRGAVPGPKRGIVSLETKVSTPITEEAQV